MGDLKLNNPDAKNKHNAEVRQRLFDAMMTDDKEAQQEAFTAFTDVLQDEIIREAKGEIEAVATAHSDEAIQAKRGNKRVLTSQEKKYFNAVIERNGFENVKETFPITIFEDVFRNLQEDHPILSQIDMRDTTGLARYVFAKPNTATAFWGPICEDIRQMIIDGFESINLESSRLSGFVPVCKGMLELGPAWLAQYVMTVIQEIMSTALEIAIVTGDGANKPIGMMRQLSGAVDGVYPEKAKVTVKTFEPKALAGIRSALAEAKTDKGTVSMLVNPVTYWLKVFPNLAFRTDAGTWVHDVLPTGEEIIQSHAVPEDTLIFGDLKNYFLGASGNIRIDRYDQTLAIEDMELFVAKFYGYGVAKDPNAFFVADISTMTGGATKVPLEDMKKAESKPDSE